MVAGADIEIGSVRLRTGGDRFSPGRTALRLRVDHLLETADLRPDGISPSAVLILRTLPDPLPGRLAPQRIQTRVDRSWERAARQAISDAYQRAYRPANGPIPTSADAVLFSDEGEMLASLAFDLSQGRAGEHWWWRAAMRTVEHSPDGLTSLLCRHATAVPAAMRHLVMQGRSMPVVRYLTPHQAMVVTNAVLRAYGVELAPLLQSDTAATAIQRDAVAEPNAAPKSSHPLETSRATLDRHSIWSRWIPPGLQSTLRGATLDKEHACLLGIALGLYAEPTVMRSSEFQDHFRTWWRTSDSIEPDHETKPTNNDSYTGSQEAMPDGLRVTAADSVQPRGKDRLSRVQASSHGLDSEEAQVPRDDDRPQIARKPSPDRQSDVEVSEDEAALQHDEADQGRSLHPTASPTDMSEGVSSIQAVEPLVVEGQIGASIQSPESASAQSGSSTLRFEDGFPTQFGGIVYLINLMCRLDLPLCFEEDWRLATTVGPWGTLEMLARSVLERSASEIAGDPIWPALAQLDGRQAGTLPGADFQGDPTFRLPRSWHSFLAESDSHAYSWAADDHGARLWSDQGIVLLADTTSATDPEAYVRLREELQRYDDGGRLQHRAYRDAPLATLASPLLEGLNPHLRRWLSLVLPSIGQYLSKLLALGTSEAFDIDQELLLGSGHLYVSSTHVDLVLPLDAISIPLRLAGLDRDPGWLPDFGRVIKLHFT